MSGITIWSPVSNSVCMGRKLQSVCLRIYTSLSQCIRMHTVSIACLAQCQRSSLRCSLQAHLIRYSSSTTTTTTRHTCDMSLDTYDNDWPPIHIRCAVHVCLATSHFTGHLCTSDAARPAKKDGEPGEGVQLEVQGIADPVHAKPGVAALADVSSAFQHQLAMSAAHSRVPGYSMQKGIEMRIHMPVYILLGAVTTSPSSTDSLERVLPCEHGGQLLLGFRHVEVSVT